MKQSPRRSLVKSRKSSRPLMFLASSAWVAVILVILVFRGGVTAPVEPRPTPLGPNPAREADERVALGDYEAAAAKYRAALEQDPDVLSLHFALGVALSHTGRQAETTEQFRWVVSRGDPSSAEVRVAGRWLVRAGVLAQALPSQSSPSPVSDAGATGKVKGKTEWKGPDLPGGSSQVSILLRGEDEPNRETVFDTSLKLGEPYEFDRVPPGTYRLTARASETQLWDQQVTVEPGKETVLDLIGPASAAPSGQEK